MNKRKTAILAILLAGLGAVGAPAQTTYYSASSGLVTSLAYISEMNGLPHREVGSIFQDRRGFMWLATTQGLCRYDGREFHTWRKADGLPADRMQIYGEDSEGFLWLVCEAFSQVKDVVLINTRSLEIVPFHKKFGRDMAFPMASGISTGIIGPDSALYFIGAHNELIAYHHRRGFSRTRLEYPYPVLLVKFTPDNNLLACLSKPAPVDSCFVLEFSSAGKLLRNASHRGYTAPDRIYTTGDDCWYFVRSPEGGGNFYRLDKFNNATVLPAESQNLKTGRNPKTGQIGLLKVHPIGQTGAVLALRYLDPFIFVPGKGVIVDLWESFPVLKEDVVIGERGFFEDRSGKIWMGGDFGVYVLDLKKSPFRRHLYQPLQNAAKKGIPCRGINRIAGEIFVATEGKGICPLEQTGRPNAGPVASLTREYDWCNNIYPSGDNRFVYKLNLDGLVEADRTTGTVQTVMNPASSAGSMQCLLELQPGSILIGMGSGLLTYNAAHAKMATFDRYNEFEALKLATVSQLYRDTDGLIWVCSSNGLFTLDTLSGITAYYGDRAAAGHYLPAENFQHLYRDQDGVFWLATRSGLLRWDRNGHQYRLFTMADGLANNNIYAVYPDDFGNLWLSSDNGIIQFDKTSFRSRAFQEKHGVTHHEFNRLSHYQSSDGTCYFGGINGVTAFHPKDFQDWGKQQNAPLEITGFFQFEGSANRLVNKTGTLVASRQIVMHPDDRFFLLQVALLNYATDTKTLYAYKIDGIDKDWNEQSENSIRLSRLPYGHYVLKIKAQEADGHWSERELHLGLQVLRPFYLKTWFLVLLAAGLAAGLYSLYRYSLRRRLARQEAQQLRELDAMKSELYTNISHEFRTPLTVIQGMAENIQGHDKEKALIGRNVQNLLHLVGQLLDLSKLDAGNLQLHLQQSDIVSFIRYLIESFYSSAEEKKIRLVFDTDIEVLLMDFDPFRLQQVVYNLVSNALKFTGERGQVLVFSKVRSESGPEQFLLQVKDSGIGIPEDKLPFIFDRFYQVDGSHTRAGEGTGIGLALTRQLVEIMKGQIRVQSAAGKGTSFEVILPVTRTAAVSNTAWTPVQPLAAPPEIAEIDLINSTGEDTGKPVLLIIEDSKDVAAYIQTCVQDDYQIHFAHDGQSGIRMALELIPDIVISDVMMPEKDGYAVTRTLKKDERTSHIPVILLTAKAGLNDRIQGLREGADAYLIKPFHREELLVQMRNMVELRAQLQNRYAGFVPSDEQEEDKLSTDERFLRKLHRFVLDEIDNPDLDATVLGRHVYLGQAQIFRKIKAITGKTPALFIRSIRLNKAKELLQKGTLNVSEVAYSVGFSDPNYFSRSFSQEFGKPPSSYTKR